MKIITAGENKGKEYIGRYGFEDCTVDQVNNSIIIKYSDGCLSGALEKKSTLEETIKDWLYIMRKNGHEEEQIQLAIDKIKLFF